MQCRSYSCGQITLNPSDFGSRKKQPKPIWKSPETANIQQKQQIIPANNWGFLHLNVKTKHPDCFQNYICGSLHGSDTFWGEGMVTNQLCRIVVGISSQIGRDGHRDMGDVSTYGKSIQNLLGSMKPPGSNLCADTRRYKYLRAFQRVKTEGDLH